VLLWTTGPLTSDGVGAALSVSAVAVALAYRAPNLMTSPGRLEIRSKRL